MAPSQKKMKRFLHIASLAVALEKKRIFFQLLFGFSTSSSFSRLNCISISNSEASPTPPAAANQAQPNSVGAYSRLSARPMVQKQTATMHPTCTGVLLDFNSMSRLEWQRRVKILRPESEEPLAPAGTRPHKGPSVLAASGSRLQSQCL